MKSYLYRASSLKSTITFLASVHSGSPFLAPVKNRRFLRFIHNNQRVGGTLYVGLARGVPPTNTNFQLTFLLTRLQEALYETYLYRASNLKSTITFLALVL